MPRSNLFMNFRFTLAPHYIFIRFFKSTFGLGTGSFLQSAVSIVNLIFLLERLKTPEWSAYWIASRTCNDKSLFFCLFRLQRPVIRSIILLYVDPPVSSISATHRKTVESIIGCLTRVGFGTLARRFPMA